jgi:hypothetical protein
MLNRTTLSLLQRAGEALYAAQRAVAQEVQSQAEGVVHAVASTPFSPDADRAYAQLRTVARLSQELQAMDEQLRALYGSAAAMQAPETQVLAALALNAPAARKARAGADSSAPRAAHVAQGNALAQDAEVKHPRAAPGPAGRARRLSSAPRLSGNDSKVLGYLQRTLKSEGWTEMTHAAMARGAGIPLGSIGVAVKRLLKAGVLVEGARGHYRLG